jgi:glycosyltransferase involved in cell wall biosynthesis
MDGIIVKDENPTQIALAMEKIVENQTLYNYIATNAKDTVLNKFSVEIVDQKYQQIYEKLLTK